MSDRLDKELSSCRGPQPFRQTAQFATDAEVDDGGRTAGPAGPAGLEATVAPWAEAAHEPAPRARAAITKSSTCPTKSIVVGERRTSGGAKPRTSDVLQNAGGVEPRTSDGVKPRTSDGVKPRASEVLQVAGGVKPQTSEVL
jgi:hypothetical protein